MFYAPELLSTRRKGKFAKCWLAANLSRSVFCHKFRRDTIVGINVEKTCEELMANILGRDSNVKFSLYLSANLMMGAARILLYQTTACLKLQFEFQRRISAQWNADDLIDKTKKKKEVLTMAEDFLLPPPEIPITEIDFSGNLANEGDITIFDLGGLNKLYETEMEAANQLDFGALTNEQMDEMLKSGGLFVISSDSVRVLPGPDVPAEVALPEIEAAADPSHGFKVPNVPSRKEKSRNGRDGAVKNVPLEASTEVPYAPADMGFSTTEYFVRGPKTPTKHKLSPPRPDVVTPSKKSRDLRSEFDSEMAQALIPALPPTAVPTDSSTVATDDDSMVLDSLSESLIERLNRRTKRNKRKKIVADEIKELPLEELYMNRKDLFIETTRRSSAAGENIIQLPSPSAEILLTNPSTRKPWAESLLLKYQMTILEPINEPLIDIDNFRRRLHRSLRRRGKGDLLGETVRKPVDISEQERSGEVSDKLIKPSGVSSSNDTSTKDRTNTLDPIPIEVTSVARIGMQTPIRGIDIPDQAPPDLPDDIPLPSEDHLRQSEYHPQPSIKGFPTNLPRNIRNIIRDWSENGQQIKPGNNSSHDDSEKTKTSDEDRMGRQTSLSSSLTSDRSGISRELLDVIGRLECLWIVCPVIEFKELCPIDKSKRKDASQMFVILLELNRAKEVKLTQAVPFGAIYIQKYSPYF